MLGGVISFTIGYHLLLLIIYYMAYTPLTCPVLSIEHCKYRKKVNRMHMLGGVISFTIGYHLLLLIIYYMAYTPLTCPVLSIEHCKYRKKVNRMQVFLAK